MTNLVIITGKFVEILDINESNILATINVKEEKYYILLDPLTMPEPEKLLNRYACIVGFLKNFKMRSNEKARFKTKTGIFVRRLELYDV